MPSLQKGFSAVRPFLGSIEYFANCAPPRTTRNFWTSNLGRIATHSATAEARRAATHMKQVEALRKWNPADLPRWLDKDFYRKEVLPRLSALAVKSIRTATDVSHPYATLIKRGYRIPHPRHWVTLAKLLGMNTLQGEEQVSGS